MNGRNLYGVFKDENYYAYSYDSSGLRTSKNINGTETKYYWLNGILQAQKTGDEYIIFLYDENGSAYGMIVNNGTTEAYYYYVFNLQGDVIGIVDSNGQTVVEYTYGAWGDILSITGSMADTIGQKNPLRYRGYYYDNETGFYYLQSRYYDPVVQRFLNADSVISGTGSSIQGYNQFSYCFNNPINLTDETGNWPKWVKNTVKWVAKNIVKPVVKTVQKTLSKVDATYSRGINVSGTPSAFIFNLQAGISIDTKGNVAIQGSAGGGVTGGSPGASITAYQSVTNAPSIDKLEGPGYQIGGSVGVPVYGVPLAVAAGGDFNIIPDSALNTTYLGATTNVGVGTPGGEFHVEWGETATWNATRFNIFDVAEDGYIKIMEW